MDDCLSENDIVKILTDDTAILGLLNGEPQNFVPFLKEMVRDFVVFPTFFTPQYK